MFRKFSDHDTIKKLFQVKPENAPTKPGKIEINLANINLNEKLPCQEIIAFTTSI